MIRRNSNRWLFCLTWSYVKNLVTEVQNDRAKPFQAFFQQQQSLLCTFLLWADREVSEEVHQLLSLVSRHCFIADNGWRRKRMMAASSHKSHYQQRRERGEKLIYLPSPGKSCLSLTKKSCLTIKTNPVLQLCCAPTLLCFNLFSLEIGRGF